jgi:integrase
MLSADMMRYVQLHHAAGFKFRTQHQMLTSFVVFAEQHGDEFVRVDRAIEWAARAPSAAQRCKLLLEVRRFALAMRPEDGRYEVPAADALGRASHRRRIVHIYTPDEIFRLVQAASQLGPTGSIRPRMYATLFGLLAATGLRISEALALQIKDVTADGLVVRQTKFKKSRLVPLHETAQRALDAYIAVRAGVGALDGSLFVSVCGRAPAHSTVVAVFLELARSIGLRGAPGQRGPRIHDLRHTFAVRALEQCPHDADAVARHLVALSTYLGHVHATCTYWYLQATPFLMEQIADVSEALLQGGAP